MCFWLGNKLGLLVYLLKINRLSCEKLFFACHLFCSFLVLLKTIIYCQYIYVVLLATYVYKLIMKINLFFLFCFSAFALLITSCKKDKTVKPPSNSSTIGLYQYEQDSAKRVFIIISKVGTVSTNYPSVFDTGSSGMTLDATDILPVSMITSSGLKITGDSVVVNGITVTSQQSTMSYGDKTGLTREYGNLAYAPVTIGNSNGSLTTKRMPIFIYYKVVNITTGKTITTNHALDIFGVGPGISATNAAISSPLNYFDTGSSYKGFKLAALKSSNFSGTGNYVAGLLTIGLNSSDVSSAGFIMHHLGLDLSGGYSPNIPSTVSYNGQSIGAEVLFDTGTPTYSVIENNQETNSIGPLPANTQVTITTNKGFTYTYTTKSTTSLTAIENPNITGDYRTIFSIDFFAENEYLTDYTNHQIGLKND